MAHNHNHQHRRHARDAFSGPVASALAAVDAWADDLANPNPQQTVISIVYVTAPKTFSGSIGGYSTLGPPVSSNTAAAAAAASSTQAAIDVDTSAQSSSIFADTTLSTSSTGLPAASSSFPTTSPATGIITAPPDSSTISPTPSAGLTSNASPSSGGISAGGKAGLALGLLLLFGGVLALILFYLKKRRGAVDADRLEDEKPEMFGDAGRQASTRTTANAPRLSLRPVTQFLPNLGEKRQSRGNALAMTSTPVSASAGTQRPTLTQNSNRNNPFGSHVEAIDSTNANGPTVVDSVGPGGELVAAAATDAAAFRATGLARGASRSENAPKPIDFTKGGQFRGPPSPAGTEFSMSSEPAGTPTQTLQGAVIAAAGGPANSTVHRVQLDFKPSMEDELELHAGQLIRLLHEYDDGWALCIRLDRSEQGVVPRSCLSTRPVKAKHRPQQNGPRGPPPPGMRVPQQGPPRALSPARNRPITPTGQPTTPTGPQPLMSLNNQTRPHNPPATQMQGSRNTPPGPIVAQIGVAGSPPESRGSSASLMRKPVGQAM